MNHVLMGVMFTRIIFHIPAKRQECWGCLTWTLNVIKLCFLLSAFVPLVHDIHNIYIVLYYCWIYCSSIFYEVLYLYIKNAFFIICQSALIQRCCLKDKNAFSSTHFLIFMYFYILTSFVLLILAWFSINRILVC